MPQFAGTVGQLAGIVGQFAQLSPQYSFPDENGLFVEAPQINELLKGVIIQRSEGGEYDPDVQKLLRLLITVASYYIERTPVPTNTEFKMSLEDIRVEFVKGTRLPLALSATALSSLIVASILGLPWPYGIIPAVALGGPLFVSLYGLKTQAN